MNAKIKALMVSAEASPFIKVGGLADVVGSLPPALKRLGCNVKLVLPLYKSISRKEYGLKKIYSNLEVPSGKKFSMVNVWQAAKKKGQVDIYFIEAQDFFKDKKVYAGNNSEKFLFFSLASLYILPIIKFEPDLVHCHDSHVALIPDIIKASNIEFIKKLKTLYTIHNFRYQGITSELVLSTGNLSKNSLKSLTDDAKNGDINFMVQGVLNADIINTVSKTYAKEISTSVYGAGLEKIIAKRKDDLYGIVNGIDVDFFNPKKDKYLIKNYSPKTIKQKSRNKLYLQNKLGLEQDKNKVVVALVSRLYWQKGLDFFTDKFGDLDCQFVFLGTGAKEYEGHVKSFAKKFPKKVSANITFNMELAQQIYAGADIFLMPSRFEPCGLGQMIAMRYGTVPVVRKTGGLSDTVNTKLGFSFKEAKPESFFRALKKAINTYYNNPEKWNEIMINGMKKDFSWDKSAKDYIKLYKKIIKK